LQHPISDTKYWKTYKGKIVTLCGCEFGKTLTIPFNIFTYSRYHQIKVVNDKLILLASTIDFGKCIKKSDMLSIEEECRMFAQTTC
jgi:hypothetical protein